MNLYTRQAAAFRNELKTSCAALMGLVQGMLADSVLNDDEIRFLMKWLAEAENVSLIWPGNSIYQAVQEVLSDGVITKDERAYLVDVLMKLVGGTLDDLAETRHVTQLPFDEVQGIDVPERVFCFTGEFAFGPRNTCEQAIMRRGGLVTSSVSKKLHYLVVGGLGSPEWKHGSFGTKIEKAVEYRGAGVPLRIVHEDVWANSLR